MGEGFREHLPEQGWLLPPRLSAQREGGSVFLLDGEGMIPQGDLCFVVSEVVEGLDLRELEEGYSRLGRKGYHWFDYAHHGPRTLLKACLERSRKVMIYGYLAGVRSSRELEGRTETDVRYMWLAGRERPEHPSRLGRTRFRRRNLEAFEWLFGQVVRVAAEMGVLRLWHVAVDGTKVRANASWHRSKAAVELREEQGRIEDEVKKDIGGGGGGGRGGGKALRRGAG